MRRKLALGIDIGATTIKGGVIDVQEKKLLSQNKIETLALYGPKEVFRQLNFIIRGLINEYRNDEFQGIGVGAPGIVANDGSTVKNPPNFKDWNEINLGEIISREFSLPTLVENDANAAALGESQFGAGKEYENFLFVIWGTGIGGGIILNKKIFRGPTGGAGEIGHTTIDYNGPICNCGNRGCIESYIGQRYLSEKTRNKLKQLPEVHKTKIYELVGGDLDLIEPYIIALAAIQGDEFAQSIMLEASDLLGIALASILNVLDLRIVILGGGISEAGSYILKNVEKNIRQRVLRSLQDEVRVLKAKLGNYAGIYGAASLIMQL